MTQTHLPAKKQTIYFIRHNFNESKDEVPELRKNKIIGIHFNNEFKGSLKEYEDQSRGFVKAYQHFQNLSKDGGLVIVQYSTESFHIGEIEPGTRILSYNLKKYYQGNDNFLKILQLQKLSEPFAYSQYPLLSALRPPYVTITQVSSYAHNLIDHLYNGKELELIVNNLHPKMLEQMCDEWLRSEYAPLKYRIRFELMRTGLTLPVIDIYAETMDGNFLNVQVTHANEANKVSAKAKELQKYMEVKQSEIALFLGPEKRRAEVMKYDSLEFVSVEFIFDTLLQDLHYIRMLETMIGMRNSTKNTPANIC